MTPFQNYSTAFIETDPELAKEQKPVKIEQVTIKSEPITVKEEQIPVKIERSDNEYEVEIAVDNAHQNSYDESNGEVVVKIEKIELEPLEVVLARNFKENTEETFHVPIEHIEIKLEKLEDLHEEQKSGKIKVKLEKGTTKSAPKMKQSQDNCPDQSPCECEVCHKVFKNLKSLKRHTPSHEEKKFSCEFCSKTYMRGNSLAIHLRRHTGETPFVCDYCNYNTHTRLSLITHIRLHTGEKPYKCKLCIESFRTRSSLNAHKKRNHGIISRKNDFLKECHLCQKVIKSSCTYKKHMDKHLGIGPVCDICKKKFSAKGALRTHMQKHIGIRNYPCTVCHKAFFTKSHLKSHIRAHEDKKPYECNLCGFRFNQTYHLNAHILVHEKSGKHKRFKCDECEKSFMNKNYLMKHITCVHNAKVYTTKKQKKK